MLRGLWRMVARRWAFILVLCAGIVVSAAVGRADQDRPMPVWPPAPHAPGTPSAQIPVPSLIFDYYENFQATIDKARSSPVDILFDGDVLTQNWGTNGLAIWQKRFAPLNAIHFGYGRERVGTVLWRLKNGELEGLHPKLIVLEIGQYSMGVDPPEQIAGGISDLVAIYRQQCPDAHIVLFGIFPPQPTADHPYRAVAKKVNELLARLDDGQHISYVDIGDKFLNPDGSHKNGIAPDFENMQPEFFDVWADAIQPFVDKYCPKSALSTAPSAPGDTTHEPSLIYPLPPAPPGVYTSRYPDPPIDPMRDFARRLPDYHKVHADLIFDGDSITFGWAYSGKDIWNGRYAAYQRLDMGVPADRVQSMVWREQNGELDGQDPKLIVLLIGTNNLLEKPEDIAGGVAMAIHECETRCPHAHILLQGVFPRGHEANTDLRKWVKELNTKLAAFASDPRVTFLDFGDKFLEPDGTLSADIMPDFLHPNAKGYVIWADAIQPVLDRYLK